MAGWVWRRLAVCVSVVVVAVPAVEFVLARPAVAAVTSVTMQGGGPGPGAVSCTGPATCTAVYESDAVRLVNGVWQAPQDLGDIEFGGWVAGGSGAQISCSDALDCTAVGASSGGPAVVSETDGVWGAPQTLSAPGSYNSQVLLSVSCADALDCTAVGSAEYPVPDSDLDLPQPNAATESNGVWGPLLQLAAPSFGAAYSFAYFSGVSCWSVGNCVGVGDFAGYPAGASYPIAAAETKGVWSTYELGSSAIYGSDVSVSCPDASDCTAVGVDATNNAIAFSVAGASIGAPTVIGTGSLTDVDCVGANDCVAVNWTDGSDLYLVETDGVWAPVPFTNGSDGYDLGSVSCTSLDDCTAIGNAYTYVISNTPAVAVADNAPQAGHDLVFTTTVTGTDAPAPTGAITWNVVGPGSVACASTTGPVSYGNVSTYTCTVTGTEVGSYQATADFGGDAQYGAIPGATDTATVSAGSPDEPTNVGAEPGNGAATVSWTVPNDNGSDLTNYVVTPFIGYFPQAPQTFTAPATSATLTGLTNGTTYRFEVAATNGVGTGANSTPSNAVKVGTPTSPTNINATAGTGSATVTWTAPSSNNGAPITSYVITPYLNGIAEPPKTYTSTALKEVVTGLQKGQSYTFEVAGGNTRGTGTTSVMSNTIKPK